MKNSRRKALQTGRSGVPTFKWGMLLLFTIPFWLTVSPTFAVDELEARGTTIQTIAPQVEQISGITGKVDAVKYPGDGCSFPGCNVFQLEGADSSIGAADT